MWKTTVTLWTIGWLWPSRRVTYYIDRQMWQPHPLSKWTHIYVVLWIKWKVECKPTGSLWMMSSGTPWSFLHRSSPPARWSEHRKMENKRPRLCSAGQNCYSYSIYDTTHLQEVPPRSVMESGSLSLSPRKGAVWAIWLKWWRSEWGKRKNH